MASRVFYLKKYRYILALEMASPGNQHCANCVGTLSFPILTHRDAPPLNLLKKKKNGGISIHK